MTLFQRLDNCKHDEPFFHDKAVELAEKLFAQWKVHCPSLQPRWAGDVGDVAAAKGYLDKLVDWATKETKYGRRQHPIELQKGLTDLLGLSDFASVVRALLDNFALIRAEPNDFFEVSKMSVNSQYRLSSHRTTCEHSG